MRTAKEKECPTCHQTVMRLTERHLTGLCLAAAVVSPPTSEATGHTRKTVMRDCPGCGKPFGRLRQSGMCKSCEGNLPEEQKAAIEAARPAPKPVRATEVVIGGRYSPVSYFAEVLAISEVDETNVVEFRLNGGARLYATQSDFLSRYQPAA